MKNFVSQMKKMVSHTKKIVSLHLADRSRAVAHQAAMRRHLFPSPGIAFRVSPSAWRELLGALRADAGLVAAARERDEGDDLADGGGERCA